MIRKPLSFWAPMVICEAVIVAIAPLFSSASTVKSSSRARPGTIDFMRAMEPDGVQAGDEPDELIGMGADVAAAAGGARLGGIDPPRGLLVPLVLAPGGQPALGIPGLDLADLADLAVPDQLPGQHDHRVAGVGVRDDERDLLGEDQRVQPAGLVERGGQRLLAEDSQPGARRPRRRVRSGRRWG